VNNPPPCPPATPHCLVTNQIRPYLGWGDIIQERSDITSNYNSLQLSATKRKGIVTAQLSYTFSKVLTEGGGVGDAYNENPEPECPFTCLLSNGQTVDIKRYLYGKASFDRTHIFSASYTLQSPWFRNSKGFVGGALGGWELSGITRFQSGAPLTITANSAVGTGLSQFSRRSSVVPGHTLDDLPKFGGACPAHKICWFDGAAFAAAPVTSAGNAPIGSIIGPNYYTWDLSLRKTFKIRESLGFMFQADAFNIFNRVNWNNPGTSANGGAGQITTANPPRQLQFGGKFTF
jgi:hypothetical protein